MKVDQLKNMITQSQKEIQKWKCQDSYLKWSRSLSWVRNRDLLQINLQGWSTLGRVSSWLTTGTRNSRCWLQHMQHAAVVLHWSMFLPMLYLCLCNRTFGYVMVTWGVGVLTFLWKRRTTYSFANCHLSTWCRKSNFRFREYITNGVYD